MLVDSYCEEDVVDHELVESSDVMLAVSDIVAAMVGGELISVVEGGQRAVGLESSESSAVRYLWYVARAAWAVLYATEGEGAVSADFVFSFSSIGIEIACSMYYRSVRTYQCHRTETASSYITGKADADADWSIVLQQASRSEPQSAVDLYISPTLSEMKSITSQPSARNTGILLPHTRQQ
jgi:hypothetical protein